MPGPHDDDSAALYTATQLRELDHTAIEEAGIPGYTLISQQGRGSAK
jgi:hypothetical protein